MVQLANALPRPLSLACFLETLERPLQLYASQSELSAQPAAGARSPRIFIYLGSLLASVAPDGAGRHLVELGEERAGFRSLKAELEFPIEDEVPATLPFTHVKFDDRFTACAFCHAAEESEAQAGGVAGYVSQALRPLPRQRVPLAFLRAEAAACQPEQEPERCAILAALFAGGDALDWEFPPEFATFGE